MPGTDLETEGQTINTELISGMLKSFLRSRVLRQKLSVAPQGTDRCYLGKIGYSPCSLSTFFHPTPCLTSGQMLLGTGIILT